MVIKQGGDWRVVRRAARELRGSGAPRLLTLACVLGGCGQAPEARPNVVMIVLDTTRPEFTSAYGADAATTPFLESFAQAGARFERAYSSSSWTLPAHGTLFTGVHPKLHRANQTYLQVDDELPLLAEQLAAAGYQTAAFSGNLWVGDRAGLNAGFEHFRDLNKDIYRPRLERLAADREGATIPPEEHYIGREVCDWLETGRDATRPFFLFVNLVEPHLPYLPSREAASHFLESPDDRWRAIQDLYPGGREMALLRRHYRGRDPIKPSEWRMLRRMYRGELRVADEVARVIIEAVDGVSDPGNTLCFVLSDHGENFGDHGHFTHVLNVYDSNLRIVLLARGPGFDAGRSEPRLVGIHDLYPTVLRGAGLAPRAGIDGVDLRRAIPEDRVLAAALEYPVVSLNMFREEQVQAGRYAQYQKELDAAIGPRFKLIRATDRETGVAQDSFFDLIADPDESKPLGAADVDPAVVANLRRSLALARARAGDPPPEGSDLWEDEEAVEELRAMGYAGTDE